VLWFEKSILHYFSENCYLVYALDGTFPKNEFGELEYKSAYGGFSIEY